MDWENIREFLGTVNGAYTAGAVGAFIALGTGYLTGKLSSNHRKENLANSRSYDLEDKRISLEHEMVELEKLRTSGDPVELRKLEYASQASERADKLKASELERRAVVEDAERERREEIEDLDRSKRFQLEDQVRKEAYALSEIEKRSTLAIEISGALSPVIQAYAEAVKNYHSEPKGLLVEDSNAEARTKYRADVVDAILEKLEEGYGADEVDYDITDEDKERVNRIVYAKYPLPEDSREPQMPIELKRLLDLIPNSK